MTVVQVPDVAARGERIANRGTLSPDRLRVPHPDLAGAVVAMITRNTSGLSLSCSQRITHRGVTPWVSLWWFDQARGGFLDANGAATRWHPFQSSVVLSGAMTRPAVLWDRVGGHMGVAHFTPDVAQTLLGVDVRSIQDRFVDARSAVGIQCLPLIDALPTALDDERCMALLVEHLAPRWRVVQTHVYDSSAEVRTARRRWVSGIEHLADRWKHQESWRQVERRVKTQSGGALRQWQSFARSEALLFTVRDRVARGAEIDWAEIAQETGFADQAHLCRAAKQYCGFTPTEFVRRFRHDESFWLYRLWADAEARVARNTDQRGTTIDRRL